MLRDRAVAAAVAVFAFSLPASAIELNCGCGDPPVSFTAKEPALTELRNPCTASRWGAFHVLKAQSLSIDAVIAVEQGKFQAVHDLAVKSLAELKKAEPWYETATKLSAETSDAAAFAAGDFSKLEAPLDQAPWVGLVAMAKREGTTGLMKELRNIVGALEGSTSSVIAATEKGRALPLQLGHDYVATWGSATVKGEAISRLHHVVAPMTAPKAPEKKSKP